MNELGYPSVAGFGPGFKVGGTSEEAARSVSNAATLRQAVMAMLRKYGPRTADAVADLLGESVLSIRPRFSELRKAKKIHDTGERRLNTSGKRANVWKIA